MAKKRILIIDDEKNFTYMVKLNLEQSGNYEVKTASNGEAGIAAARELKPDLILLDIMMPDMGGDEVAAKIINENKDLAGIPIVFLTAIVKKDEVESQDGVIGGHPFIAKPVSAAELMRRIEAILKK